MSPAETPSLRDWALVIDSIGTLLIAGHVAAAVRALATGRGLPAARALVAEGAVAGLSYKLAGTLLNAIGLHTWDRIGAFAAVLALRTLLKALFAWEVARAGCRRKSLPPDS